MITKASLQRKIVSLEDEVRALRMSLDKLVTEFHRNPPQQFVEAEQVSVWRSEIEEFYRDMSTFNERMGQRVAKLETFTNKLSGDVYWHERALKLLGLKVRSAR